ncbi:MAG: hypothetical protein ACPG4N_00490 [Gammaproteobacteria bacterium]
MMGRRAWGNVGLLLAGLLAGLGLAEWILRQLPAAQAPTQRMDPGLIQYDPRLGWALSPAWRGVHEHEEFTARYRIEADGWRVTPDARSEQRWRHRTLWLGDSMTFGLGVDDTATFVNQLNRLDTEGVHLNRSVPGYSTDQQILAFERILRRERFDRAVLVTYLANDLVDNALEYPMQAERRKPRFELLDSETGSAQRLELRGVPVVLEPKPLGAPRNLGQVLLTDSDREKLAGYGSALLSRLVGLSGAAVLEDEAPLMVKRAEPYAQLYHALLDRWFALCTDSGIDCRVLMLPGRSLVVNPESVSAALQNALFKAASSDRRVVMVDVPRHGIDWFYPRDGHLTPQGHLGVAKLMLPLVMD